MKYLLFVVFYLVSLQTFGQDSADGQDPAAWKLDPMPKDPETDFALSALPPHIRADATVYLLDPEKGYYIAHQGKNAYMCFLVRTEWERGVFRQDLATAISYDAEGQRTIFPVYREEKAQMMAENAPLLRRLIAYRSYFDPGPAEMHH